MENLLIRKALPKDAAEIAPLFMAAMEDLVFKFIGETSVPKAAQFFEDLISKEANQYSYENCWVVTIDEKIIGAACVYDGADLAKLRVPVIEIISKRFGKIFNPEDETQAGEQYIDSVGVNANYRGKGIGSTIFSFLINEYVVKNQKKLGLLVDKENPDAKKLYFRLGFKKVGEKTLMNKPMEHLQYL